MKRFLCDYMCAQLARWLRAAGYDTEIAKSGVSDPEILQQAIKKHRYLLTRDRDFKEKDPEEKTVFYLEGESLDEWAEQIHEKLEVDWLYQPFSRCLECNYPLVETTYPGDVPPLVREQEKQFWYCRQCHKTFWLGSHTESMLKRLTDWQKDALLKIGLGGDLMIGRGVDEYLALHPTFSIWGDLKPTLSQTDLNIVNLETTLTHSTKKMPKVFNFKADPKRVQCLQDGPIHVVNLANNHILDFSKEGLWETLETLDQAHIFHIGAGKNSLEAKNSVILKKKGIKVGVLGCTDNEPTWEATNESPGTFFVTPDHLSSIEETIHNLRDQTDLVIVSIHWGPNMRKRPLPQHRAFAHGLIDLGVDLIHGHSAHVFQGVEVYKEKVILYDTGDLVDDYAIDPQLRNDRSFFFVIEIEGKKIQRLHLIPTIISNNQVNIAKGREKDEMYAEMKKLSLEWQTQLRDEKGMLFLDI